MKYHLKPEAVDAVQWLGGADQALHIVDWICATGGDARYCEETTRPYNGAAPMGPITTPEHIWLEASGGPIRVRVHDYIVRSKRGAFTKHAPASFDAVHDAVTSPTSEHRRIAEFLGETILDTVNGVEVFVSSVGSDGSVSIEGEVDGRLFTARVNLSIKLPEPAGDSAYEQ